MDALAVAGFHRSGTSMVTEILVRAGLFVGEDLIGANESNPYGHFEDRDIVRLHDRILADLGLTWQVSDTVTPWIGPDRWRAMARIADHRRARHRVWGFKDPRVCFFLAPWKYLVPDLKVLVVYRDPRECANSLVRRHASQWLQRSGPADVHLQFWKQPDLALRMWVAHNRSLVEFARGHRTDTLVLPHQAVLGGFPVVDAVNSVLGFDLSPVDNREVVDPAVVGEAPATHAVASSDLVDSVLQVWSDLEELADEDGMRIEEGVHGLSR